MSGIQVATQAICGIACIAFGIHLAVENVPKVVAVFRDTGTGTTAVAELVADYAVVAQAVSMTRLMITYNYKDRTEL